MWKINLEKSGKHLLIPMTASPRGCCVKVCPRSAIEIWKGIMAKVDFEKCVGCSKCAKECPASVIEIREVAL